MQGIRGTYSTFLGIRIRLFEIFNYANRSDFLISDNIRIRLFGIHYITSKKARAQVWLQFKNITKISWLSISVSMLCHIMSYNIGTSAPKSRDFLYLSACYVMLCHNIGMYIRTKLMMYQNSKYWRKLPGFFLWNKMSVMSWNYVSLS